MIDCRCPVNPRRLFARVTGGVVVDGNLIEVACADCRASLKAMGQTPALVLHRYNALGECIETEVVAVRP